MKSGFLYSDHGKIVLHSVFQALFLTLKEYVNDPTFQTSARLRRVRPCL